ncbi:hypothetical protein ACFE04_004256 [Oxalis oulophora]
MKDIVRDIKTLHIGAALARCLRIATLSSLLKSSSSSSSSTLRNLSYGTVNFVLSQDGKPKFETHEIEPPKKDKWKNKKRFKMLKKREQMKRRAANKTDPRRLNVKGKNKKKFENVEERIKNKLQKARIKEGLLIKRLKRYEVAKVEGPEVKPHSLTGEERFYLKKMGQKRSNYCPIGRRGVFGGVILNMHMHWKKHETVKVICNEGKPSQTQEYAEELARLSGGIPIQIIGDDTIIFYRGKDYVQPVVMSPIDTLTKKKALEKSKYEQSLESVRHLIAIAEKELDLYYRHISLYGDPNNRDPISKVVGINKESPESRKPFMLESESNFRSLYKELSDSSDNEESDKVVIEDDGDFNLSESEYDSEHDKEDNNLC